MFWRSIAIIIQAKVTNTTEIRINNNTILSEGLRIKGFNIFSPNTDAGARIAPDVVLNKAESSAPKNKTCMARGVNFITNVGINKSSSASKEGYSRTPMNAINNGNIAIVKYIAPAAILALAAIFLFFADITR